MVVRHRCPVADVKSILHLPQRRPYPICTATGYACERVPLAYLEYAIDTPTIARYLHIWLLGIDFDKPEFRPIDTVAVIRLLEYQRLHVTHLRRLSSRFRVPFELAATDDQVNPGLN